MASSSRLHVLLVALFLLALVSSAHAGSSSSCSKSKLKKINACTEAAYAEEAALPNGPCYSEDWDCVCRMQQGLIDCWQDNGCSSAKDAKELRSWNSANCAGQHGVANKAAGGDLVFDLTKVKSASGQPEPTASKKDHKKHKHGHKSTATDDAASTTARSKATPALEEDDSVPSSTYANGFGNNPYALPSASSSSASNFDNSGNLYVAPAGQSGAGLRASRAPDLAAAGGAVVLTLVLGGAGLLLA
ncbi:hypothetical protein OC842_006542 [Tilletia horrida]|uniref:Extracellular membrane protein CFEM domain-containing protein n=1 Tax=Tilletia horrida TaxID=155126 RepID=A0AAN6GA12_9BASI|nr:hypothetical protein OC842_006542 [Tilletia horrida]